MVDINKIYNEDCLITMMRMPDNFVDLVVTSPPYDNLRKYDGFEFDFESIAQELFRVVKQGGVVVWVTNDATINGCETGTSFKQSLYFKEIGFNLHDTMIFEKNTPPQTGNRYQPMFDYMFVFSKGKPNTFNPLMEPSITIGRKRTHAQREKDGAFVDKPERVTKPMKYRGNIWKYYTGYGEGDAIAQEHPARFPEKLAEDHIISWSTENDLVYDPFVGSGTTAKMAMLNKRNYIGSDISSKYCVISNKRIELHNSKPQPL